MVGKQLMVCVTCNQLSKGHSMQSLLEKKTYRSAYLYHTHKHMVLCMYTCSCMPTTFSPSPSTPPPPPSHTLILWPQRMHVCVPRCMPIARLGLLHNTIHSHIPTPFFKSLVNVWVRVHVSVCVYMCVSQRVD